MSFGIGRLGTGFGRGGAASHHGSIDPLAPAAPTLVDLATASDTGSSSTDNITTATTPDLIIDFGTSLLQNDVIDIRDSGSTIVSHTVSAGEAGGSNITLGTSLAEGAHVLSARHTRAGHTSLWSSSLTVTVDTTAPVLSAPASSGIGATAATVTVSSNEANGTLYGVITTSSTTPTKSQIKAGQNDVGSAAIVAFNQAVSATGTQTANVAGLTASTTYYAHFMHEDLAGNQSTAVSSASFTTAATVTATDDDWTAWMMAA